MSRTMKQEAAWTAYLEAAEACAEADRHAAKFAVSLTADAADDALGLVIEQMAKAEKDYDADPACFSRGMDGSPEAYAAFVAQRNHIAYKALVAYASAKAARPGFIAAQAAKEARALAIAKLNAYRLTL